ncbi:MAG TPA: acetylxylan esterase [Actinomycetes bacterium]|nr:acetylxylan esterase [Actinomycetes bacterium]
MAEDVRAGDARAGEERGADGPPGVPLRRPPLSRPLDFFEFWTGTLAELERVPVGLRPEPPGGAPGAAGGPIALERFSFASLGGARVHGHLLRWRDGPPRPLVVHGHGYGGHSLPGWAWARAGLHVAGVDVRGFGRSRAALPSRSRWGYVLTGIQSPERHVLRGAVCDYLRAARAARERLGGLAGRTVLHGASFAGGLALMAEAVAPLADLLVVAVPSLGWAEGRHFFARSGSGAEINRYLERRPQHAAEDLMVVLRYFDPVNFAERVRCPTLVGVGMADEVVPAPTVLAIAARLGGPHEVLRFPVSHSDAPERREWARFERRWLALALEGAPAEFGTAPTTA